jgi:hypothetical protein
MADGGIAGYPDDDFVTRNQSVVMMAEGGVAGYQTGGVLGDMPGYTPGATPFMPQAGAPEELPFFQRQLAAAREKGMQYQLSQAQARIAQGVGTAPDYALLADAQRKADASAPPTRRSDYETAAPAPTVDVAPKVDAAPKVGAAPKADTGRRNKPAPATETASADKEPTGLDALVQQFTRSTDLAQGALRNQRAGLASQLEKEATDEAEATKKRIKEEGDVFAGKEARLAAREKGIEGMGDKYMGLALLEAGAAMMSTPGKFNLGRVLGAGIPVGSARYVAGIDKINAAKDKFAEARDRLDDLRLNRDDMNKKEVRDADRAIRNARLKGQELLVDGATNDLKISNDNQKAIFGVAAENIQTDKKITSAEKIARLQASSGNRNNQLELLQALQADPKLMAAYRTMQGKNEDVMGQYNDYLKANPALALDPKAAFTQFLMTKSAFAQLGASPVTEKAAGPVRKQP